ncbi:hypothetical protein ACR6C2_30300 [Streptomyces sp. INA 01156]
MLAEHRRITELVEALRSAPSRPARRATPARSRCSSRSTWTRRTTSYCR